MLEVNLSRMPQKGAMMLLSEVLEVTDTELTALVVTRQMSGEDTTLPVAVGVEYMAQAAAAFGLVKHDIVRQGMVGSVRKLFFAKESFAIGQELSAKARCLQSEEFMQMFDCSVVTLKDGELLCSGRIGIVFAGGEGESSLGSV